jgi:metal-sulfur cluster biosynthetic enzyme
MENIIQNKIDSVLDRIKEPQSGLSLSQIGFVEKIRCNSEGKKLIVFTLTLQKYLVQKRFARSISGHQETIDHFQDLTVCSIRFRP